jgi:hypothetical protein
MQYCLVAIYLHSGGISSWCLQIFGAAHFYQDVSSSWRELPIIPLNQLSLGLFLKELQFRFLYAFEWCHRELSVVTSHVAMHALHKVSTNDFSSQPYSRFNWPCGQVYCYPQLSSAEIKPTTFVCLISPISTDSIMFTDFA